VPGLVDVAAAASKRCGFFYNWEPLRDLARPEALHASFFRAGAVDPEMDDFVCDDALQYLAHARPQDALDFAFIYFGTVDEEGHRSGWMSEGYLRQLRRVDALVGRVLHALPRESTVLIQSDHGGHDRLHGTLEPEDMTIPWMLRTAGVAPGEISAPVSILDSAPTLAHVMGLRAPAAWEGRVVGEALR
jgi:arylsulfatase A-like enzyme